MPNRVVSMGNDVNSTTIAERLRLLQTQLGLTIQEMSDRCGLPKRSLENYMNLRSPQRPGVDALIAIADGLGASIDWIVGRSDDMREAEFSKEDYAVFCQSAALHLLIKIVDAVRDNPDSAIDAEDNRIMGYELHELAAVAMLDFINVVNLQASNANRPRDFFRENFQAMSRWAERSANKAAASSINVRKP